MALLDQEIPSGSDDVTLELLYRCTGHYCVVKVVKDNLKSDSQEIELVGGLVASLHVVSGADSEGVSNAEITLLRGLTEFPIKGSDIAYMYAIDLPLAANPDLVADLLGFRGAR